MKYIFIMFSLTVLFAVVKATEKEVFLEVLGAHQCVQPILDLEEKGREGVLTKTSHPHEKPEKRLRMQRKWACEKERPNAPYQCAIAAMGKEQKGRSESSKA